jgi:Lysyl oxidase
MRGLKTFLTVIILLIFVTPAALSQRTSENPLFPVYDNGGKPDLVVDPQRFVSKMKIVDRNFDNDPCALQEGAVGGAGNRRILRFDTVVLNSGDADLVAGDRNDPNNPFAALFEFAPCHGHFHIRDFAVYELLNKDRTIVLASHKQGFCMDESSKHLTNQWIDITGVPEGDYIVRVRINTAGTFDEGANKYTNAVETSIHVPNPGSKVRTDDSPRAPAN